MAYIEVTHEFKRYQSGDSEIVANNDVSFSVEKGELVVILGASGAGKSTLLNILGGMDTASEGQVIIDGNDIAQYSSHQLTNYRRTDVGFVFQFYNLVPNLTALEYIVGDFDFVSTIAGPSGDSQLSAKIKVIINDLLDAGLATAGLHIVATEIYSEPYAREMILSRVMAIINMWLANGGKETPEQVAAMICRSKDLKVEDLITTI